MNRLLSKVISIIKGEKYIVHSNIPSSYIFSLLLTKSICLFWALLRFRRFREIAFLHPSSVIKCKSKIIYLSGLSIDRYCYIDALSELGIIFGKNVSVGKFTTIECTGNANFLGKGLIVGDNVGLGTRGHYGCAGGVKIGKDTIIGNYVSFHSENHNYHDSNIPIRLQGVNHKGIVIGENCWIGAKVTILDGSTVGNGCIIAAGSVVRGEFPENAIIGGVPAKILKFRFEQ